MPCLAWKGGRGAWGNRGRMVAVHTLRSRQALLRSQSFPYKNLLPHIWTLNQCNRLAKSQLREGCACEHIAVMIYASLCILWKKKKIIGLGTSEQFCSAWSTLLTWKHCDRGGVSCGTISPFPWQRLLLTCKNLKMVMLSKPRWRSMISLYSSFPMFWHSHPLHWCKVILSARVCVFGLL